MAFGVNEEGFNIKPLETVKSEIEDQLKADIDPGINVSATSVLGQLIGVFSAKASELWEVGQAIYAAFDPEAASGTSLDNLSSLTGTLRNPASKSTVTATVSLNNGTTLPAGSKASVSGDPTAIFVTLEAVTNSSGFADDFDVNMESEETGPIVANSGTLTEIVTPVAGWTAITNLLDAELGSDIETDSALRLRREQELRATGAASVEALKADVSALDDVEEVIVYENTTLTTDGDGIPGKAFEVLVLGGDDQEIADQIFASKAAGIEAHGSETETVTDSQGFDHTIKFTRPTEKTLLVEVFLTETDDYPADGDNQVKTNINTMADADLGIGDDVIISRFYEPIFDVSGVEDVTTLRIYDNSTLGSEVLSETNFATHANWDVTGDMTDNTGAAVYTHSAGSGTLTQQSANFASAATGNRWYKFSYTVSGATGTNSATITTAFAHEATSLTLTNGVQTTYVFSKSTPGNFVISATSTSGGFTIDDVTLKAVTQASGNYSITARQIADIDTDRIIVVST